MKYRALVASAFVLALAAARPVLAEPPPLETYGKLPGVEMTTLSPSGERVALITVTGDQRTLAVVGLNGTTVLNAPIGDSKVRGVAWAGDDHVLVTVSQTARVDVKWGSGTHELNGVLHIDLRTGKTFWVLGNNTKSAAIFDQYGAFKVGDRWHADFVGLGNEFEHPSLFRVDLETGASRAIGTSKGPDTTWLLDPKGEVVARAEYDQISTEWTLSVGPRVLLKEKSPLNATTLLGLGRTADTALVSTDGDTGLHLREIALAGDKPAVPLGEGLTITEYLRDHAGLLIGLKTREAPGAVFFDAGRSARWKGVRKFLDGYEVELVSATDDLGKMIVKSDGGDDAGTYWTVDTTTGKADEFGHAYPTIAPVQVGPTRMVAYKAADGLAMDGVLTLPPGREAKNLPLVVLPHGGPIIEGDRIAFNWWAQAFAARGYAVFQPNYRGSVGYGPAFRDAAVGEWGGKMQTDLSDGVSALAAQGLVDPKRVCIVGGSYGGYAALAGVTLQHGIYRCAASVAGISDLRQFISFKDDRAGYVSDTSRWFRRLMNVNSVTAPVLVERSPVQHAAAADAPILLVHGTDDTVVPPAQSQAMEKALKAAGKPVQLVMLDKEDHGMSREATRTAMLKAVVGFVEMHNPPN